ncbi:MAG: 50S ribosomal protein L17 [Minisyncoccia bacterium]
MKHLKKGKKFHRKTDQRNALLKNLATNLITHGRIRTTDSKAKETKKLVERLISYAKKQNLSGYRLILKYLPEKTAKKLYYEIAPQYLNRNGGYTRIIKTFIRRKRDATEMVILELVK